MSDETDFQSGALIDDRPPEEKENDYQFSETVAAINPVTYVEKTSAQWRKFPIFNQNGSGSCVAQTLAKLLGVIYWLKNQVYVHFSATDIYQRRANKPNGGMGGVDAFSIASKGVTLEELVPSQNMTDAQMDATVIPPYKHDVGSVFKVPNYLSLPIKDIDTVASVIQTTGKAVMVWFYFEYREWTDEPTIMNPSLDMNAPTTCRHSVAAVDFCLYNGKKALIIDESWGKNITQFQSQRVITEDFFKARNFYAAYPMSFIFDDQTVPVPTPTPTPVTKPRYTFKNELTFGETNADIKALQDILRFEGFYPVNVSSTGFYGAITASGFYKWQLKHNVADYATLQKYMGKSVGPRSIVILNNLYS